MDKRFCIFDMDGTLVDSMRYWKNLGLDYLGARGIRPEEALLLKERREALMRAISRLGIVDRNLFYRKYYYMQSTAQIAAETGATERAVEGRLHRLRKKLRRELGGELGE